MRDEVDEMKWLQRIWRTVTDTGNNRKTDSDGNTQLTQE